MKSAFRGRKIRYFCVGGGTPSLMNTEDLDEFFKIARANFNISSGTKIAFEASPSTLTEEKLRTLKKNNVHWLAVGIQSLDDKLMKRHNRVQNGERALEILKKAKKIGIKQVEADLMCGLPHQGYESFIADVKKIAELDLERIYIFDFQPRYQCAFEEKKGSLSGAAKEEARRFRRRALEILTSSGYIMRCGHWVYKRKGNQWPYSYDQGEEGSYSILGLGPSAVSYAVREARYQNICDEYKYEQALLRGKYPIEKFVGLSMKDEMINFVLLETLHRGRIPKKDFRTRFGKNIESVFGKEIKNLSRKKILSDIGPAYAVLQREEAAFEIKKEFFEARTTKVLERKYRSQIKSSAQKKFPVVSNPLFNRLSASVYEFQFGGRCNLNCLFCPNSYRGGILNRNVAALNMCRAKKFFNNILFAGGEPTVSADLGFFLKLAKRSGFIQRTILTNGMKLADHNYLLFLKNAGLNSVFLKTASRDYRINAELFGTGRQLPLSLKALENLKKAGIDLTVVVVLTGLNLNTLTATIRYFGEYQVKKFILWFPRYTGNFEKNSQNKRSLRVTYTAAARAVKKASLALSGDVSIKTLNIPLCFLYPEHDMAADVLLPEDRGDARESQYGDELVKMSFEYECRFLLNCAGAASDYLKTFGSGEIRPILKNNAKRQTFKF